MSVTFDTKDFDSKVKAMEQRIKLAQRQATMDVGEEILRLSSFEVPHDKGILQGSGKVERSGATGAIVGYGGNAAPYAARLHEHPEYNFQKGRKGKYLEDPIKHNLSVFKKYMAETINKFIHT